MEWAVLEQSMRNSKWGVSITYVMATALFYNPAFINQVILMCTIQLEELWQTIYEHNVDEAYFQHSSS